MYYIFRRQNRRSLEINSNWHFHNFFPVKDGYGKQNFRKCDKLSLVNLRF
jgi:hypothetical protein